MNNDDFKRITQSLVNSPKRKVSDNWILGQANRRRDTKEIASEKRKKLYDQNPDLKKVISERVKQSQTPEILERQAKKAKDYWKNLSPEEYNIWYEKRMRAMAELKNDAVKWKEWNEKNKKARIQASKNCMKPIMTPDGKFEGLKKAAEFYNINPSSMRDRMKHHPDKYYYIKK